MPKVYSYFRFSSPEQKEGTSIVRQTEFAHKYVEGNPDLILDTSLRPDEGLSAFHADHVSKGHLGQFLELVKQGRIEKGSILVVEALDRLSREHLWTASDQFR